jgi:hypothetical protein
MIAWIVRGMNETGPSDTSACETAATCGSCGGTGEVWICASDIGAMKVQCQCRRLVKSSEASSASDWLFALLALLATGFVIANCL